MQQRDRAWPRGWGSSEPQLLGEPNALQLSGRALGNLGDDEYFARDLEVRHALRGKLPQILLARLHAIPQHYGTFPVLTQDTKAFTAALEKLGVPYRIMQPGSTLTFKGRKLAGN